MCNGSLVPGRVAPVAACAEPEAAQSVYTTSEKLQGASFCRSGRRCRAPKAAAETLEVAATESLSGSFRLREALDDDAQVVAGREGSVK